MDLAGKVDVVILAVKPQDFDVVLRQIKDYMRGKLVISIAAGITTAYIKKILGAVRVVRAMPNIFIKIGKGMICLCRGENATQRDINFTRSLFRNLGATKILNENMMDAVTAVSGSGPGFCYDIIESRKINLENEIKAFIYKEFIPLLTEAAESVGFTHKEGKYLAMHTGPSCLAFLEETGQMPAEAKKQITSKKGTTEAGLEALHRRGSLIDAVKAALIRAKELSRKG